MSHLDFVGQAVAPTTFVQFLHPLLSGSTLSVRARGQTPTPTTGQGGLFSSEIAPPVLERTKWVETIHFDFGLGPQLLQSIRSPFFGQVTTSAFGAPTVRVRRLLPPYPQQVLRTC